MLDLEIFLELFGRNHLILVLLRQIFVALSVGEVKLVLVHKIQVIPVKKYKKCLRKGCSILSQCTALSNSYRTLMSFVIKLVWDVKFR